MYGLYLEDIEDLIELVKTHKDEIVCIVIAIVISAAIVATCLFFFA